jgi:hypothetical protein
MKSHSDTLPNVDAPPFRFGCQTEITIAKLAQTIFSTPNPNPNKGQTMNFLTELATKWAYLEPAPAFIVALIVTIIVINLPTCLLRARRNHHRRKARRN